MRAGVKNPSDLMTLRRAAVAEHSEMEAQMRIARVAHAHERSLGDRARVCFPAEGVVAASPRGKSEAGTTEDALAAPQSIGNHSPGDLIA